MKSWNNFVKASVTLWVTLWEPLLWTNGFLFCPLKKPMSFWPRDQHRLVPRRDLSYSGLLPGKFPLILEVQTSLSQCPKSELPLYTGPQSTSTSPQLLLNLELHSTCMFIHWYLLLEEHLTPALSSASYSFTQHMTEHSALGGCYWINQWVKGLCAWDQLPPLGSYCAEVVSWAALYCRYFSCCLIKPLTWTMRKSYSPQFQRFPLVMSDGGADVAGSQRHSPSHQTGGRVEKEQENVR